MKRTGKCEQTLTDQDDLLKKTLLHYSEIYTSIQGEGAHSGLPCFFIRTSVCDIRCTWCDTPHALGKGKNISLEELLSQIPDEISLVQITGGEPLIQRKTILKIMEILTQAPFHKKIILETGGHHLLEGIPKEIHIVMDIKLPGSGEEKHDFQRNFSYLKQNDEIKFVIRDRRDFEFSLSLIQTHHLDQICSLVFSPVWGEIELKKLAEWILKEKAPVRLQTQLHKIIWGESAQGV